MKRFVASYLAVVLFGPALAMGHEDVAPYAEGGKIVTGGREHGSPTANEYQRVFGYDFGEEPLDPYFIEDPGFNNDADVAAVFLNLFGKNPVLPAGGTLRFNILDTLGSKLLYWDGTGPISFGPALAGTELGIKKGSLEVQLSGAAVTGTLPAIGTVDGNGRVHVHMDSILYQDDEASTLAPDAPAGIYLFGMSLFMTGAAIDASDPIYMVYNNGLTEEIHDEAMDWVAANLAPEPSSIALAGISLLGLMGFARRRLRKQIGMLRFGDYEQPRRRIALDKSGS
jgi:hypothetical protein